MTDEYNIGVITSIQKGENELWEVMIDTGNGIEKSTHMEYYAKKFKVGQNVIYFWRKEFKRISGMFSEGYFEIVRDQIENEDEQEPLVEKKKPLYKKRDKKHPRRIKVHKTKERMKYEREQFRQMKERKHFLKMLLNGIEERLKSRTWI